MRTPGGAPLARPGPAALRAGAEAAAAGLPGLLLAAERLASVVDAGAHGLRRAGTGDEFWQYRAAQPGDPAASIDWRRSARSDAAFVREREMQSPQAAAIWVAATPGMDWTGDPARPTKQARGALLALALGLVLLRGGERVAVAGRAPRGGRTQAEALGRDLIAATGALPDAGALRPGQRLVLIGDFLDDPAPLAALTRQAAAQGVRGAMLQVLDPVEETFPFHGAIRFRGAAATVADHLTRDAAALRGAYLARLADRRALLGQMADASGLHFGTHDTAQPPAQALMWLYQALAE